MIKIINFQRKNKEKQKKIGEGFKEKKKTKFTIFEEPGREKFRLKHKNSNLEK